MKIKDVVPKDGYVMDAASASMFDPQFEKLSYIAKELLERELDQESPFGFESHWDKKLGEAANDPIFDTDYDHQIFMNQMLQEIVECTDNTFEEFAKDRGHDIY